MEGQQTMANVEKIVFGGGCFWCVESVFRLVKGVKEVKSGYSGGETRNPSYTEVCSGQTGHAEVVEVKFDPKIVSFRDLLEIFFKVHNPTTRDRQGNDVGSQYRSIILYINENQKKETIEYIKRLKKAGIKAVTEVKILDKFWPAGKYRQRFLKNIPKDKNRKIGEKA